MLKPPTFDGLASTSKVQSKAKKSNAATSTKVELILRRALWNIGARYRIHYAEIIGRPDIAFLKERVAVFCDGDFWHGRDKTSLINKLAKGSNATYWTAKIAYNIERDLRVTTALNIQGWIVIRLWESDIVEAPIQVAYKIIDVVSARRSKPFPS